MGKQEKKQAFMGGDWHNVRKYTEEPSGWFTVEFYDDTTSLLPPEKVRDGKRD